MNIILNLTLQADQLALSKQEKASSNGIDIQFKK